jgi:4-azaleucine resistance transporter AzlC
MAEPRGRGRSEGSDDGPPVRFTRRGLLRGAWRALPVAVSTVAFGLVFGVLSGKAGLSLGEAALMSALVFTGSGQAVAIGMWTTPIPTLAIVATTLLIGLRHMLMGLSLQPWYSGLPAPKAYASYFFLTDESWGLTTVDLKHGSVDAAFLPGAGLVLFAAWVGSTAIGRAAGTGLRDPSAWGLDFALIAVFIALLVSLSRGKSDLLPWGLAAIVATAAERWLPGNWYVLLGAAAGSLPGLAGSFRE